MFISSTMPSQQPSKWWCISGPITSQTGNGTEGIHQNSG